MGEIWYLKTTRCSEDSFRVEKQVNTWDSGNIGYMPHETTPNLNAGQIEFLGEKPP
jgi:hypothetical protein